MLNNLSLTLLFTLFYIVVAAQNEATSSFVKCVEEHYGTSNLLVNGRTYKKQHPRASGNPYFKFDDWTKGTIYINGIAYVDELIKYDLVQNEVVLKKILVNGTSNQIVLNDNIVDSFSLQEHLFISNIIAFGTNEKRGFTEKIYDHNFQCYRNQDKRFDGVFSDRQPHGNFTSPVAVYFIKKDGVVHSISKKKDLLAQFDAKKSAIKKFMKQNKIKLKKASKSQLSQLMKFIDNAQ